MHDPYLDLPLVYREIVTEATAPPPIGDGVRTTFPRKRAMHWSPPTGFDAETGVAFKGVLICDGTRTPITTMRRPRKSWKEDLRFSVIPEPDNDNVCEFAGAEAENG